MNVGVCAVLLMSACVCVCVLDFLACESIAASPTIVFVSKLISVDPSEIHQQQSRSAPELLPC